MARKSWQPKDRFERGLDRVPAIEEGEPVRVACMRTPRRPLAAVPLCAGEKNYAIRYPKNYPVVRST